MRRAPRVLFSLAMTTLVGCSLLYDFPDFVAKEAIDGDSGDAAISQAQDGASITDADAAPPRPSCDAAGVVAYWTLDEGAGKLAHDCSPNKLDGIFMGDGGPSWVGGVSGTALGFDPAGGQFVTFGSPTPFDIYGDLTLSAWVKLPSALPPQSIIGRNDGWQLIVSNGSALFIVEGGDSVSGTPIAPDTWTHIAGVLRGGVDISVYVGTSVQKVPTAAGTGAPVFLGGPVSIGFAHDFTRGAIDEVRIYNRALTAEEIAQLATR